MVPKILYIILNIHTVYCIYTHTYIYSIHSFLKIYFTHDCWFSKVSTVTDNSAGADCWCAFLSLILILKVRPLGSVRQNYGILRVSNWIQKVAFVGFISLDFFFFLFGGEWPCLFSSYYSDLIFKDIFVSNVDIIPKPQLGNRNQPTAFVSSSVPWPPFLPLFGNCFFFPLKDRLVCINSFPFLGKRWQPAGFCPQPALCGSVLGPPLGRTPSFRDCCCLVAQSCPVLCDPVDCSPPGSVHGVSQARALECVAISFSRGSSRPRNRTCVSCVGRQLLSP